MVGCSAAAPGGPAVDVVVLRDKAGPAAQEQLKVREVREKRRNKMGKGWGKKEGKIAGEGGSKGGGGVHPSFCGSSLVFNKMQLFSVRLKCRLFRCPVSPHPPAKQACIYLLNWRLNFTSSYTSCLIEALDICGLKYTVR